jgi:predicted GNAT family N-acyltransferase
MSDALMSPAGPPGFRVVVARWPEDAETLRRIRTEVFVGEQSVPAELEWDGRDPDCVHVLAVDREGRAIGTARLLPEGRIGRMAVIRKWRRRGVGGAMLERLVAEAAAAGMRRVELASQVHAAAFYERYGFRASGDVFMEAGIPHRHMVLELSVS